MNIAILYGTETGNAEMLADDVATELGGAQDTSVSSLADIDPDTLRGTDLNIILCSSYGDGDLPASAKPFAQKIETGKPDLSGVNFAIFGLGDSEYHATYGSGSMRLADMLVQCGATEAPLLRSGSMVVILLQVKDPNTTLSQSAFFPAYNYPKTRAIPACTLSSAGR